MATGLVNSGMLVFSGLVVDKVGGIAPMLLLIFPLPVFISLLAWLPLFRLYPSDQAALHQQLAQRRTELLDELGH